MQMITFILLVAILSIVLSQTTNSPYIQTNACGPSTAPKTVSDCSLSDVPSGHKCCFVDYYNQTLLISRMFGNSTTLDATKYPPYCYLKSISSSITYNSNITYDQVQFDTLNIILSTTYCFSWLVRPGLIAFGIIAMILF